MVSSVILTSIIAIQLIQGVELYTIVTQEDFPVLNLKSYNFYADNSPINTSVTPISLPRIFDELVFECNSSWPTKWNFLAEQMRDPSVKKIEIRKWRRTRSNKTPKIKDPFHSTFKVIYSNPSKLLSLSCENVCPYENKSECKFLNVFIKHEIIPESRAFFLLQFGQGNKSLRHEAQKLLPDERLGLNVNGEYALHVDLDTGKYACTEANNPQKQVPSIFVPCNNPDECATVFKVPNQQTRPNENFYGNCTSDFCTTIRDPSNLFVLACGEIGNTSVARAFFKPMRKIEVGGPRLYQYERYMEPSVEMNVGRITMNTSITETCGCTYLEDKEMIYTGYNREFTCSTLTSFFSHGFRWILQFEDMERDLGTGFDSTNETTQVYTSRKLINFNCSTIKAVICEAPNWNSVKVTNITFKVTVKQTLAPCLLDEVERLSNNYSCGTPTVRKIDLSDQDVPLVCPRAGEPPAKIRWTFDGLVAPEAKVCQTSDVYCRNDTVKESKITLRPNHTFLDIVCTAMNSAGRAELRFEVVRDATSDKLIVIIVCCSAAFLLLVVIIAAAWKVRRQGRRLHLTEEEIQEFQNGNPDAADAFLVPYNMDLEVPTECFTLSEDILGSGAYGKVVKGRFRGDEVAIKTLKKTADVIYLKALLSELKIMSFVGRHPNVVNLLGACTQSIRKREIYIILEFCELGDMVSLLHKNRGILCNYFEIEYADVEIAGKVQYENHTVTRLNTLDLIRFAAEIALGMDFLSNKNVIHGDLAGRNILITKCLHAKVSDFGLAKQLFEYSTYTQKNNVPLPLRWMAYESLKDLKFSIQSDVWSYGVVMWEIFSLGETPYPGMEWGFDSWREILNGRRNAMPPYASERLYKLMWDCWNLDPVKRPTFNFISRSLLDYSNNLQERFEVV